MIEQQLRARNICDPAILDAFHRVPRHKFIPQVSVEEAYADHPIPIGEDQTISQPYIVAMMMESLRLRSTDRVLEIGTGSGYLTALLSLIANFVYSIETNPNLLPTARDHIYALGIENIELHLGDGTLGWPQAAPFDAIIVSAGAHEIPPPLIEQLAEGGRLVIPIGDRRQQELVLLEKHGGKTQLTRHGICMFVPLLGKHGWKS